MSPFNNTIIIRRGNMIIPVKGLILRNDQIETIEIFSSAYEYVILINNNVRWEFSDGPTRDKEILRLIELLDSSPVKGEI